MSKNQSDQVHIDCGVRLLKLLEEALRRTGRLLPVNADQVDSEELQATQHSPESGSQPSWYDDPFAVIERGRRLIAHPPLLVPNTTASPTTTNALALAARNGRPISKEIRLIMDADRRKSEGV